MFENPPNLELPSASINSAITAAEVMERSPEVLAYLTDKINKLPHQIDMGKLYIRKDNPGKKVLELKDMYLESTEITSMYGVLAEAKKYLILWQHAEANAKIFYRTFTA